MQQATSGGWKFKIACDVNVQALWSKVYQSDARNALHALHAPRTFPI